jgi:hypothetical protein
MSLNLQILHQECDFVTGRWKMFTVNSLLFVTDKVHFLLSSYVNSENMWIWNNENPHAFHQECGMS